MMRRWLRDLDQIIRGEATRPSQEGLGIERMSVGGLILVGIVLGMIYGICMGIFALSKPEPPKYPMQIVASAVKVPALFVLTLLVTLPSLYVSNALVGSRLSFNTVVRLMVASTAMMLAVLASIGPIVGFFSITTASYPFVLLTNVLVFAVSGALGLSFLLQTLHRLSPPTVEPRPEVVPADRTEPVDIVELPTGPLDPLDDRGMSRHVKTVFNFWIVLFGLVGAQMGWVLRPFIGNPNIPFTWFRPKQSNFFEGVWRAFQNLFS